MSLPLSSSELWPVLRARIKAKHDREAQLVAEGRCASPEPGKVAASYADWVGYLRALRWVLDEAESLLHPPPPPEEQEALTE